MDRYRTYRRALCRTGIRCDCPAADVVKVLKDTGVIDKDPTSKKALAAVQDAFNGWRDETGLPFCQLSMIAACSVPSQY